MSTCFNCVKLRIPLFQIHSTNFHTHTLNIKSIPSPKKVPLIGDWINLPLMMAGSMPKLHWYVDKRHRELGPIFRDKIGPVDCVFVSDPDGMKSVFAQEGKYPIHVLPEAWLTYNQLYNVKRGIFFMDGEEWLHFRKILNNLLLKGNTRWMEECCQTVIQKLIEKIRIKSENNSHYSSLEQDLYRSSLDTILSVLLGPKRYLETSDVIEERVQELASTVHSIFETTSKLALIPSELAAKLRISRWTKFEAAMRKVLTSSSELVRILCKLQSSDDSLLGKMRQQMSVEDLTKIVTDLIMAAGDTTVYSMEWMLYVLGKNKAMQERLRQELPKDLGTDLGGNSFLKNTIKECLRLYPVAPFLTRILPEQSNVMGYDLPPYTVLILSIFSTGRDDRYFSKPDQFDPDRWSKREGRSSIVQNANLPFALGIRSCIGKKLALIQLQQTLAQIVKNFDFSVKNARDVDVVLKMVLVPSEPVKLEFRSLNK